MLTSNTNTGATTYTTIPISTTAVLSRSFQTFTSSVHSYRPWPEFIDFSAFDFPDSLSSALARAKKNSRYFFVNYALIFAACVALSLIASPLSLFFVVVLVGLWKLLYFCREDSLVVFGRVVTDRTVLICLGLVSVIVVWWLGILSNLLWGGSVGIDAWIVHSVLRNPEGLFLDAEEARSDGLIA